MESAGLAERRRCLPESSDIPDLNSEAQHSLAPSQTPLASFKYRRLKVVLVPYASKAFAKYIFKKHLKSIDPRFSTVILPFSLHYSSCLCSSRCAKKSWPLPPSSLGLWVPELLSGRTTRARISMKVGASAAESPMLGSV
jgi:hypothetical protein